MENSALLRKSKYSIPITLIRSAKDLPNFNSSEVRNFGSTFAIITHHLTTAVKSKTQKFKIY